MKNVYDKYVERLLNEGVITKDYVKDMESR